MWLQYIYMHTNGNSLEYSTFSFVAKVFLWYEFTY